ncbi:Dual specificity protein phosphatase cdc14a [Entomortierella lignicola]|nr:Dual specificity protein phosphatase cdc14a [Entomortierella lignicola]
MSPGMTFNTPKLSINNEMTNPNLLCSDTNIYAGKKHPSTPPPPPIPPRSQRRPVSRTPSSLSPSSSSRSSAISSPTPSSSTVTDTSTPPRQRIKLCDHVAGLEHSNEILKASAPFEIYNEPSNNNKSLPWFQQVPQQPIQQKKPRVLDDIDREAPNVCEFIKDRLYFMWTSINPISTRRTTYLTVDSYLQYSAFFSDFGPFNIADVFRFCCLMKERLELAKMQKRVLCLHTKPEDGKRANAAFAICCYMMLLYNKTPEEAYAPIEYVHPPITPYRDAGSGLSTFTISILDCLRGLRKGLDLGLLRLDQFDVKEYEHYERVSNGDFNWITPFFIAFAGPRDKLTFDELEKCRTNTVMQPGSNQHTPRSRSKSQAAVDGNSSGSESTPTTGSSFDSTTSSPLDSTAMSDSSSSSSTATASSSNPTTPPPATPVPSNDFRPLVTGISDSSKTSSEEEERQNKENKTRIRRKKKFRTRLTKSFQSVLDYFESHHVKCVIRLNDKTYDEEHFQARGIDHVDLIYPDGTCPPWYIVEQFLSICDNMLLDKKSSDGQHVRIKKGRVIAIHCMAGLGRTGTLIGVFLMRHFNMTARETIAFLRLMRPGSVVGPQQNWLAQNEYKIRNRSWEKDQSRSLEESRQKGSWRTPTGLDTPHEDMMGVEAESTGATYDDRVSMTDDTDSLVAIDYDQIFSRVNSEGLESTLSETDFDSESESEFDTFGSPFTTRAQYGGSFEQNEEEDDDSESDYFRDISSANMGDYSMSTDVDTSDDEESESSLESDYNDLLPHLRAYQTRQQRDLEAHSSERISDLPMNDNFDSNPKEKSEGIIEPLNSQSIGMEHIGDSNYAIPVQPRKQQQQQQQHLRTKSNNNNASCEGSKPFSNLTLNRQKRMSQAMDGDGENKRNSASLLQQQQQQQQKRHSLPDKITKANRPFDSSMDFIHDPPSPSSFNNDNGDGIMPSSLVMTTAQGDIMEPSSFPATERSPIDIAYSLENLQQQQKSPRSAGL